jgi:hypothetical protein
MFLLTAAPAYLREIEHLFADNMKEVRWLLADSIKAVGRVAFFRM